MQRETTQPTRIRYRLVADALLFGVTNLGKSSAEKVFDRLPVPVHPHFVHQIDRARLGERLRNRHVTILDQIRGPEVTGSPGDRAMQQDFTFGAGHRGRERLHRRRRIREFGVPSHGNVDLLHPEILDERGLIE